MCWGESFADEKLIKLGHLENLYLCCFSVYSTRVQVLL